MKKILVLLSCTLSLFASDIQEIKKHTQQIDDSRKNQREVLSLDVDIREYKRAYIVEKRDEKSVVVSKMIQLRDSNRG